MKKKFLIPVASAISALLGHQAHAATAPQTHPSSVTAHDATDNTSAHSFNTPIGTDSTEFSVFNESNEYLFLMQRSEAGILSAAHSSHRSHSSHSSHRSHYSSR